MIRTQATKTCLYCNKELHRYTDGVYDGNFQRRKFCNTSCHGHWTVTQPWFEKMRVYRKTTGGLHSPKALAECAICLKPFKRTVAMKKHCSDCVASDVEARRAWKFGISGPAFEEMVQKQGGLCAICKTAKATSLDHCHTSDLVRGVLCTGCNNKLAVLENYEWAKKAAEYLDHNMGKFGPDYSGPKPKNVLYEAK